MWQRVRGVDWALVIAIMIGAAIALLIPSFCTRPDSATVLATPTPSAIAFPSVTRPVTIEVPLHIITTTPVQRG